MIVELVGPPASSPASPPLRPGGHWCEERLLMHQAARDLIIARFRHAICLSLSRAAAQPVHLSAAPPLSPHSSPCALCLRALACTSSSLLRTRWRASRRQRSPYGKPSALQVIPRRRLAGTDKSPLHSSASKHTFVERASTSSPPTLHHLSTNHPSHC